MAPTEKEERTLPVRSFFMGFSLLSAWQARNKKPPAMRVETIRYTHKNTFRYDEVVQAHRNINGKVFLLWEPRLIA